MANYNYAQLDSFALSGAGASLGDTTITLKSFQSIDGVNLAMADFGSIGFGTLDPGNGSLEEQISFTGVTQNASGTATLTGVSSVLFLSPYTATSGLAKTHAGSTSFVISNTSGFYDKLTAKENDEILTGYWEAPDPITAQGLVTRDYMLGLINGGTITTNALIESGTAGETLSAGQPVYLKAADGRWWKAVGTTAATLNTIQLGIAQGSGTAGNPITGGVLRRGVDTNQSGGAAGSIGYISDTTTIATTAGTVERAVGNFLTATTFDFDPSYYYVPTASQKAAMQGGGVQGTPSSTNLFITQQGSSDGSTDQSQATQNATIAVGEANTTTHHAKVAQSFIAGKSIIKSIDLYKAASTGTFTGTMTVSIQADSAGSPSGSALASKTITNALYVAYSTGDFLAILSSELTVVPGTTYWLVIETSTTDTSNCPNLGTNSAGGYGSGSVKYFNSTDGWTAVSTIDLYFKINQGYTAKAIDGASTGFLPNGGFRNVAKNGTVTATTAGVAVAHGLGKLPAMVYGYYAEADSSHIVFSTGSYDVGNATYIAAYGAYNEGTSGSGGLATDSLVNFSSSGTNNITLLVDENVVVFIASSGSGTIGYAILG